MSSKGVPVHLRRNGCSGCCSPSFQALYAGVPPTGRRSDGVIAQMDIGRGLASAGQDQACRLGPRRCPDRHRRRPAPVDDRHAHRHLDTGSPGEHGHRLHRRRRRGRDRCRRRWSRSLLGRPLLRRGPTMAAGAHSPKGFAVVTALVPGRSPSLARASPTISTGRAWAERRFDDLIGRRGVCGIRLFLTTRPAFSDPDGYIAADPALRRGRPLSMLAPRPANPHRRPGLGRDHRSLRRHAYAPEDRGFGGIVARSAHQAGRHPYLGRIRVADRAPFGTAHAWRRPVFFA